MERILLGWLFIILGNTSILIHLPQEGSISCKFVQWLHDFPVETRLLVLASAVQPNASHGIYVTETTPETNYKPDPNFFVRLQNWQNIGVLGIVVLEERNYDPGEYALSIPSGFQFPSNITIPVGIISRSCFQETAGQFPNGVNVTVLGWDSNGWLNFFISPWYIVWYLSVAFFFVVNMGFAILKLVKGYRFFQRGITIAFICLVLELIANFLRALQIILAPFLNNFNLPNVWVLETLGLPFSLSSSILLIFFWLDLTSGSLYQGNLLSVMKIPTVITIVLLFVTEIALDFYDIATGWTSSAQYVGVGIYTFIHTITAIFYFYAASKVFKMRQDFSKVKMKQLNRLTIQVVLCGIAIFGTTFAIICYLLQSIWGTPAGTAFTTYLLWFSFFPQSFLQIRVFGYRDEKKKTTDRNSTVNSVVPKTDTE